MPKATRLKKLRLTELSGVDSPANEAEGWMVLKSKANDAKELLARVEKNVLGLDELLLSDEVGTYLAEAPDSVQSAASTLHEHLAKDIVETDPEEAEVSKVSIVKTIRDMFLGDEEVEKAEEETPEATEEETVEETPEAEAEETVEVDETDEVEKAETDEESAEESVEDTEEAPAEDAEETVEEEPVDEDEAPADEETSDETPQISDEAEAIAKELGDIVREELDPIREALGIALERIEGLEKSSARSRSLDPDVESIAKDRTPTVGDAFRIAASRSGNSVVLD